MKTDRERLVELCDDFLEGRKGVIETSREMGRWRFSVGPEDDSDFLTFTAIDSETDHLPVGRFRERWNADSLKEKDIEIRKKEEFYLALARQSAINLRKKHKIEHASPANRHPYGVFVMPPADTASRAGDTPEASCDS